MAESLQVLSPLLILRAQCGLKQPHCQDLGVQDQVPLGGVLRGLGFSPVQTGGFEAPGPGSPAPARLGRARLWLCRACFGCYPLSGELTPDESHRIHTAFQAQQRLCK